MLHTRPIVHSPCTARFIIRLLRLFLLFCWPFLAISWILLHPWPLLAQSSSSVAESFMQPISLPGDFGGRDVALGDMDNDGDLDIFVTNFPDIDGKDVINQAFFPSTVWLNRGNGIFDRASQTVPLENMRAVLLGDINQDGNLDAFLLHVKDDHTTVGEIWLNQGKGSGKFTLNFSELSFTTSELQNLSLKDIDRDQYLDIFTRDQSYLNLGKVEGSEQLTFQPSATENRDVTFYDCNSNERIQPYAIISAPHHCASGDIDGDGHLDLVFVNQDNQIDGRLNADSEVNDFASTSPLPFSAVALGDLDSDGDLDAVVVYQPEGNTQPGDIQIWFNTYRYFKNDAEFSYPLSQTDKAVCEVAHLSAVDLDQDKNLDLVSFDRVLWGQGDGTFSVQKLPLTQSENRSSFVTDVGNMDGEGGVELFDGHTIWHNAGNRTFTAMVDSLVTSNSTAAENAIQLGYSGKFADIDQDGDIDLFARPRYKGEDHIFLNTTYAQSPFSFQEQLASPIESDVSDYVEIDKDLLLNDLNDDGYPDAILYHRYRTSPYDLRFAEIRIAYGDGKGQFRDSGQKLGGSTDASVVIGDFDGDQDSDIVTQQGVWFNDGVGAFTQVQYQDFNNGYPQIAEDFDQDGDLDLYLIKQKTSLHSFGLSEGEASISARVIFSSTVEQPTEQPNDLFNSIWLNTGDGHFIEDKLSRNVMMTTSSTAGDWNHDGHLDIAHLSCEGDDIRTTPTIQIVLNQISAVDQRKLIIQPIDTTGSVKGASSSMRIDQPIVPITFTLSLPAQASPDYTFRICYSLNGGDAWQSAVVQEHQPTNEVREMDVGCPQVVSSTLLSAIDITASNTVTGNTITENTIADDTINGLIRQPLTRTYLFAWDTFASNFFGQSDNVRFRVEAIPNYQPHVGYVAGTYQWPSFSSTSYSFRLKGTQIRVSQESLGSTHVIPSAMVYRLANNQGQRATLLTLGPNKMPLVTNSDGMLPGRSHIAFSDTFVALWPTNLLSNPIGMEYYMETRSSSFFGTPQLGPLKNAIPKNMLPQNVLPPSLFGSILGPVTRLVDEMLSQQAMLPTYKGGESAIWINSNLRRLDDIQVWIRLPKLTESFPSITSTQRFTFTLITPHGEFLPLRVENLLPQNPTINEYLFRANLTETQSIKQGGTFTQPVTTFLLAKPELARFMNRIPDGRWALRINTPEAFVPFSFEWGLILRFSDLYYTSAKPTFDGLEMSPILTAGVHSLIVTETNPLLLFPLDVALEWDARSDPRFLAQLENDLKRTSDYLFDWTNGQVALGRIRVYHDAKRLDQYNGDPWSMADIRIYATNRLRPNAAQGGIVDDLYHDPITPSITYAPGQVNIGAVWNRFGDTKGNLAEDWPRTLAHELGHYLLFLDDNYVGTTEEGLLVAVTSCTGAMADQYSEDNANGYDEFHNGKEWSKPCQQTLSNQRTGRADWQTIQAFYPQIYTPTEHIHAEIDNFPGPAILPLDVTQVRYLEPLSTTSTIAVPIFYLNKTVGANARAYLFKDCADDSPESCQWLIDLGNPQRDQVVARGAQPKDRLCVFDLSQQQSACKRLDTGGNDQLRVVSRPEWQPQIQLTPHTSQTLHLQVTGVPTVEIVLKARLFPQDFPASLPITLSKESNNSYSGSISLTEPALAGYLHLWVDQNEPETIIEYALGGIPSFTSQEALDLSPVARARLLALANTSEDQGREALAQLREETSPARWRPLSVRAQIRNVSLSNYRPTSHAFVMSSDGQVSLYSEKLQFQHGEYFTLQSTTLAPQLPIWATMIGQAYHLESTSGVNWQNTSINFGYFESDVRSEEEPSLAIYFWDTSKEGGKWEAISAPPDTKQNQISAKIKGRGIYALFSTLLTPIHPGWNLIGYPASQPLSITALLESFTDKTPIQRVYGYENATPDDPWRVYLPNAPDWVSDLHELQPGRGYLLYADPAMITQTTYLRLKGSEPNQLTTPITYTEVAWLLGSPPAIDYRTATTSEATSEGGSILAKVTAWVNGVDCGQGQAVLQNGQVITYMVKTQAAGLDGKNECGAPGRIVTFTVNGISVPTALPDQRWEDLNKSSVENGTSDADRLHNVSLHNVSQETSSLATPEATSTPTATLEAATTPEATAMPEVAATGEETPAVAPTPSYTCQEMLADGGFEQNHAWKLPLTDSQARIIIDPDHPNNHLLQLGRLPDEPLYSVHPRTLSTAYQAIRLPSDLSYAVFNLRYRVQNITTHDRMRLALLDPTTQQPVVTFIQGNEAAGGWQESSFDITAYRGRWLWLYFEVRNDWDINNGQSAVWVDDVRLQGCK